MLLVFVKIGEPTEEDKKRTTDALTVTNISAFYVCQQMSILLVKSGFSKRWLVQ